MILFSHTPHLAQVEDMRRFLSTIGRNLLQKQRTHHGDPLWPSGMTFLPNSHTDMGKHLMLVFVKTSHSHVTFCFSKFSSLSSCVECTSTLEKIAFWNYFCMGIHVASSTVERRSFYIINIMFWLLSRVFEVENKNKTSTLYNWI